MVPPTVAGPSYVNEQPRQSPTDTPTVPQRHTHRSVWSGQSLSWHSLLRWVWAGSGWQLQLRRKPGKLDRRGKAWANGSRFQALITVLLLFSDRRVSWGVVFHPLTRPPVRHHAIFFAWDFLLCFHFYRLDFGEFRHNFLSADPIFYELFEMVSVGF